MSLIDSTVIIADDLTGANDTALQFFKNGCSAKIIIDYEQDFSEENNIDVYAISSESRNIDKKEAVDRVLDIINKLNASINPENYYKKIDSTLRGNTGLEILAVLEATGLDAALVAPAYIEENRTTIGAYQLLNGIPIERTQCALDPKAPIVESYIPNILKKDFNPQLENLIDKIDFKIISKGAGPITLKINELIQKGKKIIVLDAISTVDLEQIALAINKSNYKILPVGSAGLANAINKLNDNDKKFDKITHLPDIATLLVSGSATKLTYNQIKKLKEENKDIFFVDLKVKDVIAELDENLIDEIVQKLNSKVDVVVHWSDMLEELKEESAKNELIDAGIAQNEFSSKITNYLADLLYEINLKAYFSLVMIGGETSYKCVSKINSKYLQVLDAIMPAIPLCIDANGKIIVTKSGNFGTFDTLVLIFEYFKELKNG